jgi:hypothetical protein
MRKAIEYTARPLSILSAFQRDSLPGMIYVEDRSAKQVQQACEGLVGIYLSHGIHLVPIDEKKLVPKYFKCNTTGGTLVVVKISHDDFGTTCGTLIVVPPNSTQSPFPSSESTISIRATTRDVLPSYTASTET